MKSVFFALILLASNTYANNLTDKAQATLAYQKVGIIEVKDVTSAVQYTPENPNSAAQYRGQVIVTVKVEGNVCKGKPESLGMTQNFDGGKKIIGLAVATDVNDQTFCPMYSKPTEVSFSLPILAYAFKGEKLKKSLGFVKYADGMTGNMGEKEIIFSADGPNFIVIAQ